MGFFRALGRWVGRKVESIGNFIGSEKIAEIGSNIQDACADKVGSEIPYDKQSANIHTTDRLNDILISFSEGYFQQATTIEEQCVGIVEKFYDDLIDIIDNTPELSANKANLKALKSSKAKIKQSIEGGIKEPLAKRMSLDDAECLTILKMDSGEDKRSAMTNFTKKVIREALTNLSSKVRQSMNAQLCDIEDYLMDMSEEHEKAFYNMKIQFEKLCKDSEMETEEREKNCIDSLLIIWATEEVGKQLA